MEHNNFGNERRKLISLLPILITVVVGIALGIFWYKYQRRLDKLANQVVELSKSMEK